MGADSRAAIADPGSIVYVSAATIWEAGIKIALGRLDVDGDLVEEIAASGFEELQMTARHASVAAALPPHHADPFDRMLIAQASTEDLVLISSDPAFGDYDVSVFWN